MRLVFATLATYRVMSEALTACQAEDRLLSYALLKDLPDIALRHYVETGITFRTIKHRFRGFRENRQAYTRDRRLALARRLKAYEENESCPTSIAWTKS